MKIKDIWNYGWRTIYITDKGKKWHIDNLCSDIRTQPMKGIRVDVAKEKKIRMKDVCLRCKKVWLK